MKLKRPFLPTLPPATSAVCQLAIPRSSPFFTVANTRAWIRAPRHILYLKVDFLAIYSFIPSPSHLSLPSPQDVTPMSVVNVGPY